MHRRKYQIDLDELFEGLDAEHIFHIIDDIILEDMLLDNQAEGNLNKARTLFDKAYDRIGSNGSNDEDSVYAGISPYQEAEQTEAGYIGFGAPMG